MKGSRKEPLWTKNFILVSTINFFVIFIFYMLMVTIAEYAVNDFGASTSTAGLIASIYIIGVLVGRLMSGRLSVLWGIKKTFFIGLTFFVITTLAYFIASSIPLLFSVRLLHGIAVGILSTATGAFIAQIIPPTRRGEGIGYYSMSIVLASAIGPFIGMVLTSNSGDFTTIFIFNAVLAAACVVTSLFVRMENTKQQQKLVTTTQKKSGFWIKNYIEPKALPISMIALLAGFAYSGVMSFLSFYSKEIHLVEAGSLFFLVYAIAILVSRPFTGSLMDRRGANIVVYPALLLFGLGMVLFSQAFSSLILLMAACLIGLGFGNFTSIAQALAIQGIEKQRLGLATTTYFILYDVGLGIGPFFLGYLVPQLGYRFLFLAMVPVILIAIILYTFLVGKKESMKQKDLKKIKTV